MSGIRLGAKCIASYSLSLTSNAISPLPFVHIFRNFSTLKIQENSDEQTRLSQRLLEPAKKEDSEPEKGSSFIVGNINSSVTDPCTDDISTIAPYLPPTFNLASYINQSPTLQELFKLGVNLHKLESKKDVPEYILRLDFDRDMKQHLRFLHSVGIPAEHLGKFLTKNPLIFKEDLDDLTVRINYLQSKKFTSDMIASILQRNPYWLNFSTSLIDARLGFFQSTFKLSGNEVRTVAVKEPRLITYRMQNVKINTFSIKEEMGFNDNEIHDLILKKPSLWTKNMRNVLPAFHYAHNEMKLTHDQLLAFPGILISRPFRIKQRHLFLQSLGRAQYNPTLEGYISPERLVSGTDVEFCQNVAKSSVESFNIFQKSL